MPRPNIVYFHTHDLGRLCEPMGYAIPSPTLQQLAEQGTLLRQCHASAPSCAPSRAALVTGQHPHCNGMLGLPNIDLGYSLNDYSLHITAFLKQHGYTTALAGVQHVAREPMVKPMEVLSYDRFLNCEEGDSTKQTRNTVEAALEYLEEDHEQPFFLSVGLLEPHRNNKETGRKTFVESKRSIDEAAIEKEARYCQPWPHMPDNDVARTEMAQFKLGVKMFDEDAARIMEVLDRPEFRENTLVIFTTDHGPGVCEMKCTLTDRGTGVVTIIRGPSDKKYGDACLFNGGHITDALTQHIDLYPTIAEIIGVPIPDHCQGKSLLPLARGQAKDIHEYIFTEQTYHWNNDPRPLRAVRSQRYRYIRCYKPNMTRGVDTGPAERWWTSVGYTSKDLPTEQFFDLYFDPHEAHNLIEDPAYAEEIAKYRNVLSNWQAETDDPLLQGIPVPPAQQAGFAVAQ